jgi:hypothetical protein
MIRLFLRTGVAAAALLVTTLATPAYAQVGDTAFNVAPPLEGVQADVEKGLLTPEQGRQLEIEHNQLTSNFQAKVDGASKRLKVTLGNQVGDIDALTGRLQNSVSELKANPNGNLGNLTDDLVDSIVALHQVKTTLIREIEPLVVELLEQYNALVQKRAEFIASNPNVSREQKRAVAAEARKIHQQLTTVVPRLIAESTTKIEATNDKLQNERIEAKGKIREEVEKYNKKMEELYGTDRKNWPKNLPPTKPKPAEPRVAQNPVTEPPVPSVSPIGRPAVDPPIASKPGTGQPSGRPGTIPNSSADPAFSVEREVTVQTDKPTTTASPKGNASASKPKTNTTVASNDPAFNANRNRPTDAPKPPPPPQTNPFDALKPIRTIDSMPSAGQKGKKPANPLETRTSPGTTGIASGQSPNPGDAGIPGKARPTTKPAASAAATAVAGALAGAGAAATDPLKDLKLPPLGRAGRGDGSVAGDSGSADGGGGDRLTAAERDGASQGMFSPADAFNSAARFLTTIQNNGILQVAELANIYTGYDPDSAPGGRSGRSLTAAPNSLPLDWRLPSVNDALQPAYPGGLLVQGQNVQSYANNWRSLNLWGDPLPDRSNEGINTGRVSEVLPGRSLFDYSNFPGYSPFYQQPLSETAPSLVAGLYGLNVPDRYRIQRDPRGVNGRISAGARYAGSLYDDDARYLRMLASNDLGGLDRLLAQPFNVLLTWGAGAFDLDLHMTGPTGDGQTDRFHIFYAARGNLNAFPFAELIRDCICASGSEVILTTQLIRGGVYRISTFNFGNQSATSTNLANQSEALLQIVRGGTAVSVGNGTTIEGGRVIYTATPPAGQPGNTWVGVEINPTTGRIFNPNVIVQSPGSAGVD